jgi:hypothetical protein
VCHQIIVEYPPTFPRDDDSTDEHSVVVPRPSRRTRDHDDKSPVESLDKNVLRSYVPQYLKYHTQDNSGDQLDLVVFLKTAIQKVQQAEDPTTDSQGLYDQYVSDVVDTAAYGIRQARQRDDDPVSNTMWFEMQNENLVVCVAAAVGSLAVMKDLLGEKGKPWRECSQLLGSPLQAAAFGGKLNIVEYTLNEIKRYSGFQASAVSLKPAVESAIRGQSAASLDLLLRFICENDPEMLRKGSSEWYLEIWKDLAAEVRKPGVQNACWRSQVLRR